MGMRLRRAATALRTSAGRFRPTRRAVAFVVTGLGVATISVGVGLVFVPAGLVVAGGAVTAYGLLGIDLGARS